MTSFKKPSNLYDRKEYLQLTSSFWSGQTWLQSGMPTGKSVFAEECRKHSLSASPTCWPVCLGLAAEQRPPQLQLTAIYLCTGLRYCCCTWQLWKRGRQRKTYETHTQKDSSLTKQQKHGWIFQHLIIKDWEVKLVIEFRLYMAVIQCNKVDSLMVKFQKKTNSLTFSKAFQVSPIVWVLISQGMTSLFIGMAFLDLV